MSEIFFLSFRIHKYHVSVSDITCLYHISRVCIIYHVSVSDITCLYHISRVCIRYHVYVSDDFACRPYSLVQKGTINPVDTTCVLWIYGPCRLFYRPQ